MVFLMEFGMGVTEIGQVLEFKLRMHNPFMIVFNFFVFLHSVLPIAQLGERQTEVVKVVGSNPTWQI